MALGWSGSNGGITLKQNEISKNDLNYETFSKKHPYPMEVSYFINNTCNLKCKHCYVSYGEYKNDLSIKEWKNIFDELISFGAQTFGNVGKEPLLAWDKTYELLEYFNEKKRSIPRIRFGLVTNGLLLDKGKINKLDIIQPDYIDISLDGTKKVHDFIRGDGSYDKTMNNLKAISKSKIIDNIFISFTSNKYNVSTIDALVQELYDINIKNILISPYITRDKADPLFLSTDNTINWIQELLNGNIIDFNNYRGLNIYIKNDHMTSSEIMNELEQKVIIDKNNLFVDDYGVLFNKYNFNENNIYFNYIPWNDFLSHAIRISHDGYISNCFDMFFPEYTKRAIGNVRINSLKEMLKNNSDTQASHNNQIENISLPTISTSEIDKVSAPL